MIETIQAVRRDVRPMTSSEAELTYANDLTARLERLVDIMDERLAPLLLPEEPGRGILAEAAPEPPRAPLLLELHSKLQRMDVLLGRAKEILDRVDL